MGHSEETKMKLRLARLGKSSGMKGRHHSLESRMKMSQNRRGKKMSEEQRKKMIIAVTGTKMAEANPMWKGDEVGYHALHSWVKSRLSKPELCQHCQQNPPIDLANKSNQYKRDLSDWEWLCRKCHIESDGRMNNLKIGLWNLNYSPRKTLEENREWRRKYEEKNKQRLSKQKREYYLAHKEHILSCQKKRWLKKKGYLSEHERIFQHLYNRKKKNDDKTDLEKVKQELKDYGKKDKPKSLESFFKNENK